LTTRNDIVHVIDDDDAVRDSIAFLLVSSGLQAKTHGSAAAFLEDFPSPDIGCVVTDIRMPEMNGIELLREIRASDAALPVIVITGHGDVPLAVEAMKLGAADFIEKPFDDDTLIESIRAALNRRHEHSDTEARLVEIRTRLATLSAREQEVLEGLVAGRANKVIAYDLGISPRTVEVYRANVMTKMQAATLSDLVRMALLANTPTSKRQDRP
jgi:two-component system, LuxR family, response regulator FixJ